MIVREYFELHGFFVCQQRKYIAPVRRDEEDVDFLVLNPRAEPPPEKPPFVLASTDLSAFRQAIVAIKGWHTETFSVTYMINTPEMFRFLDPAVFQQAARAFGDQACPARILVVSNLPQSPELRDQSLHFLKDKGIDAVLLFHTILADLIAHIEETRNYQKSDLLQMIRLLKNYEFFREPQLELFLPGRGRRKPRKTLCPGAKTTDPTSEQAGANA
jgi:hypothetical protein